jgi:hypothetical protein
MYQNDLLFLVAQMRQKEMMQVSASERLARAARKNQSSTSSGDPRFVSWIRSRVPGRNQARKTHGCIIANQSLPYLDEISSPQIDTSGKSMG